MRKTEKSGRIRQLIWAVIGTVYLLFILAGGALAEPRIISSMPANLSQKNVVTEVSAAVYGATSIAKMTIDGVEVQGTMSGETVRFERNFTVGLHKVYLAVTDGSGNSAEKVWQFYVNDPLKPYILPGNSTCEACHPSTWKNFPGHLVDLSLTNTHPHSCGTCHKYAATEQLIVRSDGSTMAGNCMDCHSIHYGLYMAPVHESVYWKGTWAEEDVTIKTPRESFDCQYCHQPSTKVRLGHDLVSDHEIIEDDCTSCHSNILTIAHNSNGMTCGTCHQSTDPVIQGVANYPVEAKAGVHTFAYNTGAGKGIEYSYNRIFNDLSLDAVSLVVYGPNTEATSAEWTPGPGLEIKRLKIDNWSPADKQYILAYVGAENKWYTISVQDELRTLYRLYPVTSAAKELYLPPGTTKIKTKVISGPGDSSYKASLNIKNAYYRAPAKCSDCHGKTIHDAYHTSPLDNSCTRCHISSLTDEHLNNTVTQTNVLTCSTCHKSANPLVANAIKTDNKQCAACHAKAHTINITEKVPTDLPIYNGFQWSAMYKAQTWVNEPWVPADMSATGKALMSNLRTDVTSQSIENYYNLEMAVQGWIADGKVASTGYLQLKYTKGLRRVYVFWYNGPAPNAGNAEGAGYRLLLLYN